MIWQSLKSAANREMSCSKRCAGFPLADARPRRTSPAPTGIAQAKKPGVRWRSKNTSTKSSRCTGMRAIARTFTTRSIFVEAPSHRRTIDWLPSAPISSRPCTVVVPLRSCTRSRTLPGSRSMPVTFAEWRMTAPAASAWPARARSRAIRSMTWAKVRLPPSESGCDVGLVCRVPPRIVFSTAAWETPASSSVRGRDEAGAMQRAADLAVLFEKKDVEAFAGDVSRRRRARRSCSHDDGVERVHGQRSIRRYCPAGRTSFGLISTARCSICLPSSTLPLFTSRMPR